MRKHATANVTSLFIQNKNGLADICQMTHCKAQSHTFNGAHKMNKNHIKLQVKVVCGSID